MPVMHVHVMHMHVMHVHVMHAHLTKTAEWELKFAK